MVLWITDSQWIQYERDGFLRLGHLLTDAELAALQQRIDAIMLGTADVPYERILMQLDSATGVYGDLGPQTRGHKGASLAYRKIEGLEQDALFLDYMRRPVFREICARVYGSHVRVGCFRAMFMNKPAQKGTELPWHQDGGDQWGLDRDPLVTVWTALDPATKANGCVQVIPGSHRLGLLTDHGHTLTPEHEAQYVREDEIVELELDAGEVMILHNWLLHRSGVNRTDTPRRAFSVCYLDARTRRIRDGSSFPVIFADRTLPPVPAAQR